MLLRILKGPVHSYGAGARMPFFEKIAPRFVSAARLERMRQVLAGRTRYVVPVFENLYKAHNAAAVIRTAEAFGVAQAHFVEGETEYEDHRDITQGSHRWVDILTHASTEACFAALRHEGYLIVGTCLHERAVTPEVIPLDRPLALVFGNELEGMSGEAIRACDLLVRIPMYGFVESLNISVSAALLLSGLLTRIRATPELAWPLGPAERRKTLQRWLYHNTRIGAIVTAARKGGTILRAEG